MSTEIMQEKPNENIVLCSSCNYYLKTLDQSKLHYKSEFHRYNMKRKIVNLAPVTLELFNSRKETTSLIKKE